MRAVTKFQPPRPDSLPVIEGRRGGQVSWVANQGVPFRDIADVIGEWHDPPGQERTSRRPSRIPSSRRPTRQRARASRPRNGDHERNVKTNPSKRRPTVDTTPA